MQLIHLRNPRHLKRAQPRYSAAHTLHQPVHRPQNPAHDAAHQHHAGRRTNENRQQNRPVQPVTKAEERILRHQAAQHPGLILIGHLRLVQRQLGPDRIHALLPRLYSRYLPQIRIGSLLQCKGILGLSQSLIQHALPGHPAASPILLLDGQHIARVLVLVQVLH